MSHEFQFSIGKNNFMHLCGIQYHTGANAFFKNALDKKLDVSKIKVKIDDTTLLKLSVIGMLDQIISSSISICKSGEIGEVRYQLAIRTKKSIFLLALNQIGKKYIPISLLNMKTIKNLPKGESVKSIEFYDCEEKISKILF